MPVDSIDNALHHGWPETEAEVTSCKYIRASRPQYSGLPSYYAVGFSYKVDGITYQGDTTSSVSVQVHDRFSIRYNPAQPDQNNSIGSVCDRPWFKDYLYVVGFLIFGLILYDLVNTLFLHR